MSTSEMWRSTTVFIKNVIVPAGAVIAVFAALFAGITYNIRSEVADMRTEVGTLKDNVKSLDSASVTTNQRIDELLKDALDRAFPRTIAGKEDARGSLNKAIDLLQFANAANIKLEPPLVVSYGKQVVRLTNDPVHAVAAWKTLQALLDYRSFLNADEVPKATPFPDSSLTWNFKIPKMHVQAGQHVQASTRIAGRQIAASDAAAIEEIGHPLNVGLVKGPEYILVEGYDIGLDGFRLRNVIISSSHIAYRGGHLQMENVYFVNCTFDLQQTQEGERLTKEILTHVPATLSPS